MNIRSATLKNHLIMLGWVELDEGKQTHDRVVRMLDRESANISVAHNWYEGPAVVTRYRRYSRLRRPAGVTRKLEKRIFRILLALVVLDRLGLEEEAKRLHALIRREICEATG